MFDDLSFPIFWHWQGSGGDFKPSAILVNHDHWREGKGDGKGKKGGEGRWERRKEGGKKEEDRETITIDKSECTPTKSTLNLQRKM